MNERGGCEKGDEIKNWLDAGQKPRFLFDLRSRGDRASSFVDNLSCFFSSTGSRFISYTYTPVHRCSNATDFV